MSAPPVPFEVDVPETELNELRERLAATRLPERETVTEAALGRARWAQGVPLADLASVLAYWRDDYDWRRLESELNAAGSFMTQVDGLDIHLLHKRSERADARPLLLTHGWPGSIVEFLDVIEALIRPDDPTTPAFHVVVPSLPGFGFSGKPTAPGWGVEHIADTWATLMSGLGYERFLAHGGDWGGLVTTVLAAAHPDRVLAIHTTFPQAPPGPPAAELTAEERAWVAATERFQRVNTGYALTQTTTPQTIGYALVDSPVGLLAWILDKFAAWTDTDDSPFETVALNRLLDDVSLYWFTRCGASAARIYAESYGRLDPDLVVRVPTAITVYPRDIERYPRAWLARRYRDITSWSTPATGGHFPAMEQPAAFVAELRAGFSRAGFDQQGAC
jgi:epoxide hydrolase